MAEQPFVDAMRRAVAESRNALGVSSPNPPVGAVIVGEHGDVIAVGHTQPPGAAHAEVVALEAAGEAARGATVVVTLEPCNHTGRTGPCARALVDAGVARVVYAVADPNPSAAGGADTLRDAGVEVVSGVGAAEAVDGPLRAWLHRQRTGRPLVVAKIAATLDGRVAAPDGTSQWITGEEAREDAHAVRAGLDAIVVGTGTALADDPSLTARDSDGAPRSYQPTRVVLGERVLPATARLHDDAAPTVFVESRDPAAVFTAVPDALTVLVEGGPTVLGAFFAADLVDEVHAYIAPTVLGAGRNAVDDPTVTTLAQAHRFALVTAVPLGDDVRLTLRRRPER
ncbi:bifunctional diaminohydroxyphosphoribosylaminopyrimidine deaminase/5-amino-6-(5-phosphoribosylamino)uracil reductase RibD [Gordonia sp. X0973]|uniref:bifunctional diaminohydroxyphosphoribosylaminopyrimidine deaminase/5-amino-6-(5-phosphoribosylamino)uracil reductase RibD n=1 Tax=Gordonia sp. X0973 TaxID=2742602 RepID=UPI000F53A52B|nr:bifunctional diaminohydroxyphosphoribosylaminopyrimidine deaminase/5-amino-6-(5-phosphoribosylamino)uracil reductase RibD [Gordonia sp. X0973]QKT07291.1 bifunctional diaminohydroxyphosphoribosylaminopyrimidine deaminase/5-amino-6-(5-phosphoribosylamino)uracil reductase RibD [Gordonia sp. X0973]